MQGEKFKSRRMRHKINAVTAEEMDMGKEGTDGKGKRRDKRKVKEQNKIKAD